MIARLNSLDSVVVDCDDMDAGSKLCVGKLATSLEQG